ncbi:MAG: transporter substrate-binding domain-containing protein [Leptolyngbya sp. SIO1D8]|nr:transporter substrate-binding domain-containing protein [Leptolyngbya sp. SIO1D8]
MHYQLLSFGIVLGVHLAAPSFVFSADLETIQERGYLIVAVKDNWRPLGFADEQGNLVGFEIDIASRLAETLLGDATSVVFHPVANRDRIPAVLNGEVDFAIAGVSITPMRERIVNFSAPYYLDGTSFLTNDPHIQSLQDLRTDEIALIEGSDAVTSVHYTLPSATLVGVPSYEAALAALATGSVSAFAGDVTVLTGWIQEEPDYRLLPDLITAEPLAIVMPKGSEYRTLHQFINTTINQWHEDSWLEEQATYWGLP